MGPNLIEQNMLDFVQIGLHIKINRLLNTLSAIYDGDVLQKSLVTISRLLLSQKKTQLTHFFQMHPFSTPENLIKPYCSLMFSEGRERVRWE